MKKNPLKTLFILLTITFSLGAWTFFNNTKPTLYIIGDSTVKNGDGTGKNGLWGWGDLISPYFDTTRISIENHARGGRSSRTFITEGLWDKVLEKLKPGDFVIMQFGHNDGGPLNTGRARASLKGSGEETQEVVMEATGKKEVVHTYGWYMRKYITDAKAKGAISIVCSQIPRNIWNDGKVERASDNYGKWAAEAANSAGAFFIDLNEIVAKKYEAIGQDTIKSKFFLEDHTHTTWRGAELNAASVVEGLQEIKDCPLNQFLLKRPE